jgi:hypothetical protein
MNWAWFWSVIIFVGLIYILKTDGYLKKNKEK